MGKGPNVTFFRSSLVLERDPEESDPPAAPWSRAVRQLENTRSRVALENRMAAGAPDLHPASPHLAFAASIARALEGSMLTPERRESLVLEAQSLGLRAFDANLVIAVVQDRARRGESTEDITGPISVLSRPGRTPLRSNVQAVVAGTAIGLAVGFAILFVRWVTG